MLITKLAGKLNRLIVSWSTLYLFTFVPNRMSYLLFSTGMFFFYFTRNKDVCFLLQ